jgi:hypothetical protein
MAVKCALRANQNAMCATWSSFAIPKTKLGIAEGFSRDGLSIVQGRPIEHPSECARLVSFSILALKSLTVNPTPLGSSLVHPLHLFAQRPKVVLPFTATVANPQFSAPVENANDCRNQSGDVVGIGLSSGWPT